MHARIQTPQMAKVRTLADEALTAPDGLEVIFRTSHYGSLKGAHAAAKGLQSAFSAMRARARRGALRLNSEPDYTRDIKAIGPYDSLACSLTWLPDELGCKIILQPAAAFGMDFEVIDRATGQPFAPEDPDLNRYLFLTQKLFHESHQARRERRPWANPLTEGEMQWAWAKRPKDCELDQWPQPQSMMEQAPQPRSPTGYESVDLADLDESELGMEEGEGIDIEGEGA